MRVLRMFVQLAKNCIPSHQIQSDFEAVLQTKNGRRSALNEKNKIVLNRRIYSLRNEYRTIECGKTQTNQNKWKIDIKKWSRGKIRKCFRIAKLNVCTFRMNGRARESVLVYVCVCVSLCADSFVSSECILYGVLLLFCLLPLVFIVRIVRIQSFIRVNGFITSTFLIFKTARKISIKMKMHIFISFRFIHDQKWERKPHQMTSIRYLETVHGTIVWTISLVCERAVFYWKSSLWNVAKVRDNGV